MKPVYPFSGPLKIDHVTAPGGAVIGMVHMPGRNHTDGLGRTWSRDLARDLEQIERWGAVALVTLVEAGEFSTLGTAGYENIANRRRFSWFHFPIPDLQAPGESFFEAWTVRGNAFLAHFDAGERVVVHCAGGLGRTGTLVAKLLMEEGVRAETAIETVRLARPGAIETLEQELYVRSSPALRGYAAFAG